MKSTVGLQLGLNAERMYGQRLALGAGLWANLNPDYPSLRVEGTPSFRANAARASLMSCNGRKEMLSLRILKNTLLTLLCVLLAGNPACAQEEVPADKPSFFTPEALYLSGGAGGNFVPASRGGFTVSYRLTGVLANGWGLSVGQHSGFIANRNEPAEFHYATPSEESTNMSFDLFREVDLCAVRKFWVRGARQQLRLGIEAGPALVHTEIKEYSPLPLLVTNNNSTPRYRAETVSQNVAGLQMTLNATYLPTQFFGLELALWGNLNRVQSFVGLEGILVLGRLKSLRSGWR